MFIIKTPVIQLVLVVDAGTDLVTQQTFVGLQDMSWRCFQHVFSVMNFCLSRHLEDVLEDKKVLHWRGLQDVLKTCLEDDSKT